MARIPARLIIEIPLQLEPTDYDIDGVITTRRVIAKENEFLQEKDDYLVDAVTYALEGNADSIKITLEEVTE